MFQQLSGHGIDPACLPLTAKGEISDRLEDCRRLEQQRQHERLNFPPRRNFDVPFCNDVLLGKGTPFQIHPGNKNLRFLVADRYKSYEKAQKGVKKVIAQEVIETIHNGGGLFLKQDGGTWIPVKNDVALLKVGAAFRTLRLKGGIK